MLATTGVLSLINQGQAQRLIHLLADFTADALDGLLWAKVCLARGDAYSFIGQIALAEDNYKQCLTVLDTLEASSEKQILQAKACRGMGDLARAQSQTEAMTWFQEGLQILGDADLRTQADLRLKLSTLQLYNVNSGTALQSIQQVLNLLPPEPSRLSAGLQSETWLGFTGKTALPLASTSGMPR